MRSTTLTLLATFCLVLSALCACEGEHPLHDSPYYLIYESTDAVVLFEISPRAMHFDNPDTSATYPVTVLSKTTFSAESTSQTVSGEFVPREIVERSCDKTQMYDLHLDFATGGTAQTLIGNFRGLCK